jgi:hypothetical protein
MNNVLCRAIASSTEPPFENTSIATACQASAMNRLSDRSVHNTDGLFIKDGLYEKSIRPVILARRSGRFNAMNCRFNTLLV